MKRRYPVAATTFVVLVDTPIDEDQRRAITVVRINAVGIKWGSARSIMEWLLHANVIILVVEWPMSGGSRRIGNYDNR